jgi:hypothetical protein
MKRDEEKQLMEVKRILSGAFEAARPEERQAILEAAQPALAALRRAQRESLLRRGSTWILSRFENPHVRLASLTLAAALILFLVLSRHDTAMRSANVYTYQELTTGSTGAPLGTSASIFRGLQ